MTDTERLNLIEHYGWIITPIEGSWEIELRSASVFVTGKTLREAIDAELKAQFEWSVGK